MSVRLAALVLALLAACGGPSAEPSSEAAVDPTPSPLVAPDGPPPEPRRYETVQEAAAALGCSDLEDLGNGGNAGLRTQGVCHIGHRNFDIYLTSQRDLWEHIAAQFPSVFGPGWIVVSPTGEEGARYAQGMLGGDLALPGS